MLAKMAWRNLWRRKRRTLITALSVAFGILLAVTFTASGDYAYTNMINSSAKMGFGHVTVEPAGYNDNPSLQKRISDSSQIRASALATPGVNEAMVRINGMAMFATASKSVGGMFIAIDPKQENLEANIFIKSLIDGKLFEGTDGKGVLVGQKMMEKLHLGIGKKLVYTTTDVDGEIVSEMARVTGIFKTGVSEVDRSVIILPIDKVRKMLRYDPDDATLVSIMIDDQRHAPELAKIIEKTIDGSGRETLTWGDTQADIAGIIAVDSSINYSFQFLVGLMIAAGILNTILMSVLERKHEFGVMMAIGMSAGRLFSLVLMESVWLGIMGLILGVIITTPWFWYMANFGIDLSSLIEEGADIGGVLVDPVMKFRLYKESAFWILTGVFSLTMVAGLYPAWRAGRAPPVDSLKSV
ncbi:hypothetical protein MNBD_NITROSPINAE02-1520 [hydrothermal vent metagenome]|uniref:ABC transporter permease n=1 Tax=hydrothermal vent metagenome TaxID=652676 RepID=A0A3B1CVD8_9ZZZZ